MVTQARPGSRSFGVPGFILKMKQTSSGKPYRGRFSWSGVQWTGSGEDLIGTLTITAEEIADAADSQLLWTDQDVQRGIQPGLLEPAPRELALANGYPDPRVYIFDSRNADDMAQKLLDGDRLFLSPLVWNLRPGTFEA